MQTPAVLGYPVHVDTPAGLLNALETALSQGQSPHVVTLNPEMLMAGEKDPAFAEILKTAELILPDGAGIVWALKRRRLPVQRVPGIEFSEAVLAHAAKTGAGVALIGAKPEVVEATARRLQERFTGLNIVFVHHGYFTSPEDRRQVAQACAEATPRYVFVALGVPGQELWIREFRPLFQHPAAFVGVGGSFDVWSGLKRRAHPLFLKLNLEWLYRITTEPFRLKRVYNTLPVFVVKVLLHDA